MRLGLLMLLGVIVSCSKKHEENKLMIGDVGTGEVPKPNEGVIIGDFKFINKPLPIYFRYAIYELGRLKPVTFYYNKTK